MLWYILSSSVICLLLYRYVGVIYGITNTAATVPGIVAPIVVAKLTPNVSISFHDDVGWIMVIFDSLKWPNTQHSGHMGQNIINWKNTTSQAKWGMW